MKKISCQNDKDDQKTPIFQMIQMVLVFIISEIEEQTFVNNKVSNMSKYKGYYHSLHKHSNGICFLFQLIFSFNNLCLLHVIKWQFHHSKFNANEHRTLSYESTKIYGTKTFSYRHTSIFKITILKQYSIYIFDMHFFPMS